MPSPLLSSLKDDGAAHLYTDEYYTFMASHVEYLRSHPATQLFELDKRMTQTHINNFHGFFTEIKVRYEDHQLLMMVNRFTDPLQLTRDVRTILVPDNLIIERLKNIFRTTQK